MAATVAALAQGSVSLITRGLFVVSYSLCHLVLYPTLARCVARRLTPKAQLPQATPTQTQITQMQNILDDEHNENLNSSDDSCSIRGDYSSQSDQSAAAALEETIARAQQPPSALRTFLAITLPTLTVCLVAIALLLNICMVVSMLVPELQCTGPGCLQNLRVSSLLSGPVFIALCPILILLVLGLKSVWLAPTGPVSRKTAKMATLIFTCSCFALLVLHSVWLGLSPAF